jgi:hypothetical protein
MRLVEQWQRIEADLPPHALVARLSLTVRDDSQRDRAAALLGPLNAGRAGETIRFAAARGATGPSPELVRRLLRLLDREAIAGELALVSADAVEREAEPERTTLAAAWGSALAELPDDWSDVYAELGLDSTDYSDRGALLLSPVNPSRFGDRPGFRFRVARRFGYGASPEMATRCLERLDAERMTGSIRIVLALSDTDPVATQGPVWYRGGKVV